MICHLVSCTSSRAGPPWGTKLAKVGSHSRGWGAFGRILGQLFDFLSLQRGTKKHMMMFWHRSKRPKITKSMAKGRLKSDILKDFSTFWEPFWQWFSNFLEHRFCIDFSLIFYMIFKLLNSIKSRFYCRRVAKIQVFRVVENHWFFNGFSMKFNEFQ